MNSGLEKVPLNTIGSLWGLAVETKMGSVSSHVANFSGFSSDSIQLNFKETAYGFLVVEEVFALNHLPDGTVVKELDHIQVLVERGCLLIEPVLKGGVETASAALTAEGHEVWGLSILKVPVFMSPVLS